mmetsp:Transcript_90177/g.269012  ORF Transcript_90177/g.269012 Transcript_90177/m.269012 type:complete len:206 (+) Transcript_90177:1528-2145(+)
MRSPAVATRRVRGAGCSGGRRRGTEARRGARRRPEPPVVGTGPTTTLHRKRRSSTAQRGRSGGPRRTRDWCPGRSGRCLHRSAGIRGTVGRRRTGLWRSSSRHLGRPLPTNVGRPTVPWAAPREARRLRASAGTQTRAAPFERRALGDGRRHRKTGMRHYHRLTRPRAARSRLPRRDERPTLWPCPWPMSCRSAVLAPRDRGLSV